MVDRRLAVCIGDLGCEHPVHGHGGGRRVLAAVGVVERQQRRIRPRGRDGHVLGIAERRVGGGGHRAGGVDVAHRVAPQVVGDAGEHDCARVDGSGGAMRHCLLHGQWVAVDADHRLHPLDERPLVVVERRGEGNAVIGVGGAHRLRDAAIAGGDAGDEPASHVVERRDGDAVLTRDSARLARHRCRAAARIGHGHSATIAPVGGALHAAARRRESQQPAPAALARCAGLVLESRAEATSVGGARDLAGLRLIVGVLGDRVVLRGGDVVAAHAREVAESWSNLSGRNCCRPSSPRGRQKREPALGRPALDLHRDLLGPLGQARDGARGLLAHRALDDELHGGATDGAHLERPACGLGRGVLLGGGRPQGGGNRRHRVRLNRPRGGEAVALPGLPVIRGHTTLKALAAVHERAEPLVLAVLGPGIDRVVPRREIGARRRLRGQRRALLRHHVAARVEGGGGDQAACVGGRGGAARRRGRGLRAGRVARHRLVECDGVERGLVERLVPRGGRRHPGCDGRARLQLCLTDHRQREGLGC